MKLFLEYEIRSLVSYVIYTFKSYDQRQRQVDLLASCDNPSGYGTTVHYPTKYVH